MAVRKKKKVESVPPKVVVKKEEKLQRVIPEIPNTLHFYSHNQNLIRMESLDNTIKIDASLIKSILEEIKERQLPGTNLFVVVYNEDGEVSVDEVIDLQECDYDEDLKKIIDKVYSVGSEKTVGVEQ